MNQPKDIPENVLKRANDMLAEYPESDHIACYPEGFVPRSYKWPAPGIRWLVYRDGRVVSEGYDKKRSYGGGSTYTPKSAKGGKVGK